MTNKLKVATSSVGVTHKRELINNYLSSTPEGATPKMIATGTTLNINTVKSILPKIENIKRVTRGWYKVLNRPHPPNSSSGTIHSWNFHNLSLTFPVENNNNQHYNSQYGLINIDLRVNNNGICICHLSTDYPMNISSISMIYGYINVFFDQEIPMDQISIKTIEFNKDYQDLCLEGVNSIKLNTLCSHFKLYQKNIGLRVEHKTKIPITAETMADMLTNSNTNIDLSTRMDEQRAILRQLTGQTVHNTRILTELTQRMNK